MQSAPDGPWEGWNEQNGDDETSPADLTGATPSNDFGTGVRGGIGYMGLSSAATLLRAIYKLAPLNNSALTLPSAAVRRNQMHSTTMSLDEGKLSNQASISVDMRTIPALPPAAEISPLIDSYFRYFRQFPLVRWLTMWLTRKY